MQDINLRLLGVYYAAQKILLNNLAAPLGHSIKPLLNSDDYELIATKAIPCLTEGVNKEKLESLVEKIFTQIESGAIKPSQYVGHTFSLEETLDQFEIHDGFMALHTYFFANVEALSPEDLDKVSDNVLSEVSSLKFDTVEMVALKQLFLGEIMRSPLTLEVNDLQEVVDCMYEGSCSVFGPAKTDQMLSAAVKDTANLIHNFNASIFL